MLALVPPPSLLLLLLQDAGGELPSVAAITAAGGRMAQSGSSLSYKFNASLPEQLSGFVDVLKNVSLLHQG